MRLLTSKGPDQVKEDTYKHAVELRLQITEYIRAISSLWQSFSIYAASTSFYLFHYNKEHCICVCFGLTCPLYVSVYYQRIWAHGVMSFYKTGWTNLCIWHKCTFWLNAHSCGHFWYLLHLPLKKKDTIRNHLIQSLPAVE